MKRINNRLSILSESERKSIYDLPEFTKEERSCFFSLNSIESEIMKNQLRGFNSKILFILQLGYFRALFRFFVFTSMDVAKDIFYIIEKYFPSCKITDISQLFNQKVRLHHQLIIKELYSYQDVSILVKQKLLKKAESLLLKDSNPKYIFRELHIYLNKSKRILPSYTSMQSLITRGISNHERRIHTLVSTNMTSELDSKILELLSKESNCRYYLTLIKMPPNSFTYIQAIKEREKRDFLLPIYTEAIKIIKETGISQQSVKYFARLVDSFTIHRIQQLEIHKRNFYILCFVCYRFKKINDALIKTFLHNVTKFQNEIKLSVREKTIELNIENLKNLSKGSEILDLLVSDILKDEDTIGNLRKEIYQILPKNKIKSLSSFLETSNVNFEKLRWEECDSKMGKLRRNIRHIFKSIVFESSSDIRNMPLYNAVIYLQKNILNNQKTMSDAPISHVKKRDLKYLYKITEKGKNINPSRYEFLVYKLLKKKIDSTDISIPDSFEYRNFDDDLIDKTFYLRNKHNLFLEYENDFLSEPVSLRIDRKLSELDDLIHLTNYNIMTKKNSNFKYTDDKKKKWHVEYKGVENKDINNPIFKNIPKINLPSLLWIVHEKTCFLNSFTHILHKEAKTTPDLSKLIGTIIAFATNMGLSKMAGCSNLTYLDMNSTREAFLREQTLQTVNESIINETSKLSINNLYKKGSLIHSSIDGKKYDTPINIFNARHSPKYFNLGKGIVVLTLVINFLPVSIKIISPNEYEGNFALELLLMNESNLQSSINSTDMHGINDLNFALYDAIGYEFHPRYTNLFEASKNIVSSSSFGEIPKEYIICPILSINHDLIIAEEDNIKRIIASILSKKCMVSTIVKKLSSSLKSHKTRKAIAEYSKILRSIHILKSINSLEYRQNIQIALNRGELYHYLNSIVGYANGGKIAAKTELEQLVFKECTRVVCNAIVFYNSSILSKIYKEAYMSGKIDVIKALEHISPIAWSNINLYGTFEVTNKSQSSIPNPKLEDFQDKFFLKKHDSQEIP